MVALACSMLANPFRLKQYSRNLPLKRSTHALSIPEQKGSIHRRNSPQFSGTGTALAHVLPI